MTDWRFVGIKKLHELPEVLESQLKSSQKNILKIISRTLISSTTIKDSFKPEYYSVQSGWCAGKIVKTYLPRESVPKYALDRIF